jgi:hypothetical protein
MRERRDTRCDRLAKPNFNYDAWSQRIVLVTSITSPSLKLIVRKSCRLVAHVRPSRDAKRQGKLMYTHLLFLSGCRSSDNLRQAFLISDCEADRFMPCVCVEAMSTKVKRGGGSLRMASLLSRPPGPTRTQIALLPTAYHFKAAS